MYTICRNIFLRHWTWNNWWPLNCAGCSVEWHWLHEVTSGLDLWRRCFRRFAWHCKRPSQSLTEIRHYSGRFRCVLLFVDNVCDQCGFCRQWRKTKMSFDQIKSAFVKVTMTWQNLTHFLLTRQQEMCYHMSKYRGHRLEYFENNFMADCHSLSSLCGPDIMDLLQREHPKILAGIGVV